MNPLHFDPLSILALTRWPGDFGSFRIDADETYSPRNQANSLKNQQPKKMNILIFWLQCSIINEKVENIQIFFSNDSDPQHKVL